MADSRAFPKLLKFEQLVGAVTKRASGAVAAELETTNMGPQICRPSKRRSAGRLEQQGGQFSKFAELGVAAEGGNHCSNSSSGRVSQRRAL